jgi:hypothetical protein
LAGFSAEGSGIFSFLHYFDLTHKVTFPAASLGGGFGLIKVKLVYILIDFFFYNWQWCWYKNLQMLSLVVLNLFAQDLFRLFDISLMMYSIKG